jgi:phosphoribosylformylglycinamidine synthase
LHDALLGLIATGAVKSAHDCAEGGLAVALAECCISQLTARRTPQLTGASLDLGELGGARVDALLFGESHGRVVITTSEVEAGAAIERVGLLGVPAARIGAVTGGRTLDIEAGETHLSWQLNELHDVWWNTIARVMEQ